ncbi:MAG: dTMP kinase [Butyricicoccus sp.]
MNGKLIVIEGLDGSGKATQAALLRDALQQRGEQVRQVSFPVYDSESSALVRMYLAGAFGQEASDVNAYAASSFYAVDRYASYKTDWGDLYHSGGTVIADRYTTSNAIHQCSKLPQEQWDSYLDWLFSFEYRQMGIPAPDQVLYLRVDPNISQSLMSVRYHGDESRKDIHERDLAYMNRSREAAEYCAKSLGWTVIDCVRNGTMRSAEEIHREILQQLP